MDTVRLRCMCATEELVIDWAPEEQVFEFGLWYRGHYHADGWRFRLRSIWHILRRGTPYTDQLILSKEDAMELAVFLVRMIDSAKEANDNGNQTA